MNSSWKQQQRDRDAEVAELLAGEFFPSWQYASVSKVRGSIVLRKGAVEPDKEHRNRKTTRGWLKTVIFWSKAFGKVADYFGVGRTTFAGAANRTNTKELTQAAYRAYHAGAINAREAKALGCKVR